MAAACICARGKCYGARGRSRTVRPDRAGGAYRRHQHRQPRIAQDALPATISAPSPHRHG